jgi:hypothetical protein
VFASTEADSVPALIVRENEKNIRFLVAAKQPMRTAWVIKSLGSF